MKESVYRETCDIIINQAMRKCTFQLALGEVYWVVYNLAGGQPAHKGQPDHMDGRMEVCIKYLQKVEESI